MTSRIYSSKLSLCFGGMALFFWGFLTNASAQIIPRAALSGRVFDDSTNAPLENVNVFIANTMLGNVTDKKGFFEIQNVPLGTHELVVSILGYENQSLKIRLIDAVAHKYVFKLKPKTLAIPSVEVTAPQADDWKKKLKKFQELFVGTSSNAFECKILNPEVLDFATEGETHTFTATASQPLQIENKALGYRLYFILETFSLHEDELRFIGKANFTTLPPANPKEMKKWERNRLATYNGSLQHCLAALATRRHVEEGFLVHRLPALPQEGQTPRLLDVSVDELISAGELPFERKLYFRGYLQVVYTRAHEENKISDFRPSAAPSLLRGSPRQLRLGATLAERISWIKLNHSEVIINTQGRLYDPLAVVTFGDWALERVADLLPWEYQPVGFASPEKITSGAKPDFYARGVQQRDAGNWTEALDFWLAAKQALTDEGKSDSRLGIAFIELVTQKKATEYYDTAGAMYFWGISNNNVNEYRESLQKELERTAPLLDEKQYSDWRTALLKGDSSLYAQIKQFWITKDPTPTTQANERLLEHWERIAYARQNFTRATNTVYGTDDRGLIYVKYGEPDRKKAGTLGLNQAELLRWVFNENVQDRNSVDVQAFNEFNMSPEYELWIYSWPNLDAPMIYIFGREEGTGAFGLRNGVEDFIPDRAFKRRSTKFTRAFLPGAILQMMFYADLKSFDPFFESRYRELEAVWSQAEGSSSDLAGPNPNTLRGIRAAYQSRDAENAARRNALPDKSDFGKNFLPIKLASKCARFLDEHDQPKLAVGVFSYPQIEGVASFPLRHTLLVRDNNWNAVCRFTDEPPERRANVSFFMIDQKEYYAHYVLAAEAFNQPDQRRPVAVGKEILEINRPLSGDPKYLELSDLVIGIEMPVNFDRSLFPFDFVPGDKIRRAETLKIYLEVYHLALGANGMSHFTIDFQVYRFEGKKSKRQEMVSQTFSFNASGRMSKENLGIDVSRLKPGLYQLAAEVTDTISSQKKKREIAFQILE